MSSKKFFFKKIIISIYKILINYNLIIDNRLLTLNYLLLNFVLSFHPFKRIYYEFHTRKIAGAQ